MVKKYIGLWSAISIGVGGIIAGVNVGHLKLYKKTHGNLILIWIATLGNLISLSILIYYLFGHSALTLVVLILVLFFSFFAEWLYVRFTKIKIKARIN